jgi:hypothetical protein
MRSLCLLCLFAVPAFGQQPMETVIDSAIAAKWKADGLTPAKTADDATLIRRLTLDLVGRIPTSTEVAAYVNSKVGKGMASVGADAGEA